VFLTIEGGLFLLGYSQVGKARDFDSRIAVVRAHLPQPLLKQGQMTEWLGNGLQIRGLLVLRQFDSDSGLHFKDIHANLD
jgi:hypothetical protein